MGSVVVGFSGGVDSTFLTYAAHQALGDRVLAVTAVSATLPGSEAADAKAMTKVIGVEHRLVHSTEFEDPDFVQNPPDRCYICKKIRFTSLVALAKAEGYQWVVDGGNVDDLGDYRPGMKQAWPRRISGLCRRNSASRPGISRVPPAWPAASRMAWN